MSAVLGVLGAAAGAYLVAAIVAWLAQPHLLFQPGISGGAVARTPAAAGLRYDAVSLRTDDGLTLAGWYVHASRPRPPVVLFLHGNAGNIGDRIESLQQFHDAGADVLIIDYRGYGASEGKPDEAGLYLDAEAAWHWLTRERGVAPARIVLFGRSLGGAVAARLASTTRPAGLVLESTFTSLPELAAELYPWLPARWLSRYRFDTEAALEQVKCPVLVAHAPGDQLVPFHHARRLAGHQPPVTDLYRLDGGHDDAFMVSQPAYTEALSGFIQRVTEMDREGEPNA